MKNIVFLFFLITPFVIFPSDGVNWKKLGTIKCAYKGQVMYTLAGGLVKRKDDQWITKQGGEEWKSVDSERAAYDFLLAQKNKNRVIFN